MTAPSRSFKEYVTALLAEATARDANEFRLEAVGTTPRSVRIVEVLEDALVVERIRHALGLELVHFATVRSLRHDRAPARTPSEAP